MLPAAAHRATPEGATAPEILTGRPAFITRKCLDGPPAATAVRLAMTPPRTGPRPAPYSIKQYTNFARNPEMIDYARRFAYAYITPSDAPCRADPGPFIRRVFRTLALDLPQTFELLSGTSDGDDMAVRFRTPDHLEAAMRRQPFVLDGVTVKLMRHGETPNARRASPSRDYIIRAELRDYPVEQRTEKMIRDNCSRFAYVREIDPACFAAPDLSAVTVLLQNDHPREIPHELRIRYHDGSTSVVPVEIVGVWHRSNSYDANGNTQYVLVFPPQVAAA